VSLREARTIRDPARPRPGILLAAEPLAAAQTGTQAVIMAAGPAPTAEDAPLTPRARRLGGLFWQRDFRLLWTGESVSEVGNAMAGVAMPLLAVIVLRASTFQVSALTAAEYLPWLLIGLPAGAWVDRLRCRPLMVACDVAAALLFASLPVAAWLGVLSIGQVLAVALLAGGVNVLFGTAYQVYLPSVVAVGDLVEGNAKLQASASAATVGGPGLAGLVAGAFGAADALLGNAVSFLVSAACLLGIRVRESRAPAPAARAPLRREISEGIRFVAGDRYLRPLTIFGAVVNLGLAGYLALIVLFMVRVVGLGPVAVGLLVSLASIGGVLGALASGRIISRFGTARALLLGAVGGLSFALLIPLAGPGPRLAFYLVGALVSVTGVVVGNVILMSFRQAYCPPRLLGRVTATMRVLLMGTSPLGALLAGGLGTWLGIRNALWIMLGTVALSGTMLLTPTFTGIRDLPAGPAGPGTAHQHRL
jgi:MFS family permease